jgi:hypothetical protein
VVHRDWSQLKELKDGAKPRGRAAQGAPAGADAADPTAAAGAAGGPGAAAAPYMGFNVEILVQKVRNKGTGSRGVAALEYQPSSGRYFELGQGGGGAGAGVTGAAVAGAAAANGARGHGGGGEGRASLAREGAGLVEVEDAPEGGGSDDSLGGVSDDLRRQRHDQEELQRFKQRQGAYDAPRGGGGGGGPVVLQRDDEPWPTASGEDV